MNNNLKSLNNYLFEAIERINDDSLDEETLDKEIKKGKAINDLAGTIINNAKLMLDAQKHFDDMGNGVVIDNPMLGIEGKRK